MSADALPITPARFAEALKDLPLSSLHLKVLELRNSIAHLDYSNEQLRPYADGTATALSPSSSSQLQSQLQSQSQPESPTQTHTQTQPPRGEPDQDCIDAIAENEQVIERMQERIRLVRAEVESRGLSWREFQGQTDEKKEGAEAEVSQTEGMVNGISEGEGEGVNGTVTEEGGRHSAWTDGTFQTGVIRGGVVQMDAVAGSRGGQGGSLTDEELRRRVEEQLRGLGGDEEEDGEGGLHL